MESVSDLIRKSDPICHEPIWSPQKRQGVRQRILRGAADVTPSISPLRKVLTVALVTLCLVFVASAVIIPTGLWPRLQAQASVRFEMRLAEETPIPGLQPLIQGGRAIYVHRDVIIGNVDIASARVIAGTSSGFGVEVTFTPSGAEKILRATANHIGKHIAMLIDGQVVSLPVLRSAISVSAMINGDFTRSEAERIAGGMIGR